MLVNGKGDELMYERGAFITEGLPFPELRARALIKEVPPTGVESPAEYSRRIRQSRPGFGAPVSLSSPGAPRAQGGGGL
jgi:hypothetical protein